MNLRSIEHGVIVGSRFFTVLAVIGSLGGSLLMFVLGLRNIYQAFRHWLPWAVTPGIQVPAETVAVIDIITGLDRFLIGLVLLYFAYGVYSLFLHPEEDGAQLPLPARLRVRQIGQLKQVVAEVILIILFVLFLRVALQTFQDADVTMTWQRIATLLVLPASTTLLALALWLVRLHPKPRYAPAEDDTVTAPAPPT